MKKSLLFCLSALLSVAAWAADFTYDGLNYNIVSAQDLTVETTYSGSTKSETTTYVGDIVIPETVVNNGVTYTVVGIGEYTFYNNNSSNSITSITISDNVTYIGDYAFQYCAGVPSITIPKGVTSIGTYAFFGWTMTSIELPQGMTELATYLFYNCTNLETVTFAEGSQLTSIGGYAFRGCSNLKNITIPKGVTSIGNYAFYQCSALESLELPERLTSLGTYAFYQCTSLKSITMPEIISTVQNYSFYGCSALETVYLGPHITALNAQAFRNCSSLKSFTILSDVVPTVGGNLFTSSSTSTCVLYVRTGLKELYEADSNWKGYGFETIEEMDVPFIVDTSDPTDVTGTSATLRGVVTTEETVVEQGFEYSEDGGEVITVSVAVGEELSVSIAGLTPQTDYSYNAYAKSGDGTTHYGQEISFNTSGYDIVSGGLYFKKTTEEGSSELTCEITWGGATSSSGTDAYTGLIVIPETVTFDGQTYKVTGIGDEAFRHSEGLTGVTIPETITYMGNLAFYQCTGLESLVIPNSISAFGGNQTFFGCSALEEVVVSDKITSIPQQTFYDCTSLAKVTLPEGLTSIGQNAFRNCSSLKELTIPAGVTSIEQYTFYGCGFEEFTVPETITSIDNYAFAYCDRLVSATIPNSVTSMGTYVFSYCKGLKSAKLSESVTSLSNYTFSNCSALTDITIPDAVTSIGTYVFQNCTSLEDICIPSGVTSIGNYAFSGCTSLGKVYSFNTTPPTCGTTNCFNNIKEDCVLYVPQEAVEAYQNADIWKDFYAIEAVAEVAKGDKIEIDGIYYTVLSTEDKTAEVTWYNSSGNSQKGTDSYTGALVIPEYAKYKYDGNSYRVIGLAQEAFRACTSLTSVSLPESVTYLGTNAFRGCTALSDLKIPDSVDTFGIGVFYSCYGLTEITIPTSLTTITNSTFYDCANLETINMHEGVEVIEQSAFECCVSLKTVDLPKNLTEIAYRLFRWALTLEKIEIPETVTSIGAYGFQRCDNLPEIIIPAAVETIGERAFRADANLKKVYSLNPVPPVCGYESANDSTAFYGVNENCVLYVPVGSKETYATADTWEKFTTIVEISDELIVTTLDAEDITDVSAVLKGTVVENYLEPVVKRGFEYWVDENAVTTVSIDGVENDMAYTAENLQSSATYTYRAYATTEDGNTIYGEAKTFSTIAAGIDSIGFEATSDMEGIYSTSGQKLNTTQRGVNIIRYNDGTTKKVLIK